MRLGLRRPTGPYSRTFSTRSSRRGRWRLRSQTQRSLALAFILVGVLLLVCLSLPGQNRLCVTSANFWLQALGMDAKAQLQGIVLAGFRFDLPVVQATLMPLDAYQFGWHLALLLPLIGTAHWLARQRPSAGWALGALCAIHLLGMVSAALSGPAKVGLIDHSLALGLSTRALLLLSPLFAICVFVLESTWARRLGCVTLLFAYLVLAEPLKLVAHAWLVQAGGPLMMPTLFIAFGPAFDVIALTGILSSLLAVPPARGERLSRQ